LAQADVVLHDALVSADVLALVPEAKLLNVGKRANRPCVDQRLICRLLVRLAGRHQTIVRLKGGDPGLFGRATEEIVACREAGVPVAIVPGVTAAVAGAAALGVSLTARGVSRSVAFVTPTTARGGANLHWAKAAAAADTAVIYMGAMQAGRVRASLIEAGLPSTRAVALVEDAKGRNERIVRGCLIDLPNLAAQVSDGPVLIVVGDVVAEANVAPSVAMSVA
jgi:uroporphyrin-III C-methyltransferase